MDFKTKFDIIQDAIIRLNDLADARGVDKCVTIINLVQNLNELNRMLHEEDATHDAAITSLTKELDKYKEAGENAIADAE